MLNKFTYVFTIIHYTTWDMFLKWNNRNCWYLQEVEEMKLEMEELNNEMSNVEQQVSKPGFLLYLKSQVKPKFRRCTN